MSAEAQVFLNFDPYFLKFSPDPLPQVHAQIDSLDLSVNSFKKIGIIPRQIWVSMF